MSAALTKAGAGHPAMPGVTPLSWEDFRAYFASAWRVGEHVTLLGHTGSGKTTLAVELLDLRAWVVALGTKPQDDTLGRLIRQMKWPRIRAWKDRPMIRYADKSQRLVLWPDYRKFSDIVALRDELQHALEAMFAEGRWTVFADELSFLTRRLGMGTVLHDYWTQGRSIGLTLVGTSQRPRHIPLEAYSQATHLFVWRENDKQNVRRLAEFGGLRSELVKATVPRLPEHVALYMNTRTGEMATVLAPTPQGKP